MTSESEIINFKTLAWADPRMVEWYANRVTENVSENRLKNQIEIGMIGSLVRGHDILDVGIGSGRASLPLLETGISLTGIDSSQAMLDECRRRAGKHPIRLQVGDVNAIPFPDASFDSLVSLNVMTHFPNWHKVLREWLRVLRPGGRLVFDIYSLDQIEAVMAQRGPGLEHLLPNNADINPSTFNMRVRVTELAEFALAEGITLLAIHPYCGTLGGDQNYWMEQGWANGRIWDRMKSWIAEDEKLFDFFVFLETNGYAYLNSKASGRFMVVFEKKPDNGDTERLLAHQTAIDVALASPVRLSNLAPFLGLPMEDWRSRFNSHLDHPPNRLALFQLLTAGLVSGMEIDLADWLESRHVALFDRWLLAFQLDQQIYQLASTWFQAQTYDDLLEYKGVPLGPGLLYESVQELMRAAVSCNASVSEKNPHV
jgi:SAM-dependent methyltransferase